MSNQRSQSSCFSAALLPAGRVRAVACAIVIGLLLVWETAAQSQVVDPLRPDSLQAADESVSLSGEQAAVMATFDANGPYDNKSTRKEPGTRVDLNPTNLNPLPP